MLCKFNREKFELIKNHIVNVDQSWIDDGINLEEKYFVYGIGIYNGSAMALIDPMDDCRPVWYEFSQFEVMEGEIPSGFSVFFDAKSSDWTFIAGYSDLVHSEEHFNGILERDKKCLEEFRKVKMIYAIS
jgi:hypothetical protein